MKIFIHSCLTAFLLYVSAPVHAATVGLFKCGKQISFVRNYDDLVLTLKPGDRVPLCNGETITIREYLSHGKRSAVFTFQENTKQALILPLAQHFAEDLLSLLQGEALLNEHHVAHARILKNQGHFWAMRELLPKSSFLTFDDFDLQFEGSAADLQILAKLKTFAKSIRAFNRIGDFHDENFIYSFARKEWLLLDWSNKHILRNPLKDDPTKILHPFRNLRPEDELIQDQLDVIINDALKFRKVDCTGIVNGVGN